MSEGNTPNQNNAGQNQPLQPAPGYGQAPQQQPVSGHGQAPQQSEQGYGQTPQSQPAPGNNQPPQPAPGQAQQQAPVPGSNQPPHPAPGQAQQQAPAPDNNQPPQPAPGYNTQQQSQYAGQSGVYQQNTQQPYQQGYIPPQAPYGTPSSQSNGLAVGSLVCGIMAICFSGTIIVGAILGIIAIVLGVMATKNGVKDGKATGGKITGAIGLAISLLIIIIVIVGILFSIENTNSSSSYSGSSYSSGSNSSSSPNSSSSNSSSATSEDDKKAVEELFDEEMKSAIKPSDAVIAELATEIDDDFEYYTEYTMAMVGADPKSIAQQLSDKASYKVDSVYVYESLGTATVYATAYSVDAYDYSDVYYDELSDVFLNGNYEDFDLVRSIIVEAANKAEASDRFVAATFTKKGDKWVIDDGAIQEIIDMMYM